MLRPLVLFLFPKWWKNLTLLLASVFDFWFYSENVGSRAKQSCLSEHIGEQDHLSITWLVDSPPFALQANYSSEEAKWVSASPHFNLRAKAVRYAYMLLHVCIFLFRYLPKLTKSTPSLFLPAELCVACS